MDLLNVYLSGYIYVTQNSLGDHKRYLHSSMLDTGSDTGSSIFTTAKKDIWMDMHHLTYINYLYFYLLYSHHLIGYRYCHMSFKSMKKVQQVANKFSHTELNLWKRIYTIGTRYAHDFQ